MRDLLAGQSALVDGARVGLEEAISALLVLVLLSQLFKLKKLLFALIRLRSLLYQLNLLR